MADELKIKDLAAKLYGSIKQEVSSEVGNFLDEHSDADAFVLKQTRKMAELSLEMVTADDAGRARIKSQMERVQAVVDTELLSIANDAAPAVKDLLKNALKAAWGVVKEILPIILPTLL